MTKKVCRCDGWWFPHTWGCLHCNFREEFVLERSFNSNPSYESYTKNNSVEDLTVEPRRIKRKK